ATERPSAHVEDPTIEQLAAAAGRTDEIAVRRQLFGWRELISTVIPVLLIGYFARNVDWSQAFGTLRRADPLFVVAALVVYYLSFPVRAIRWARLLREGGTRIFGRDLLEILLLGWFVNCLVPAKLGDLYRSYLVKRRFGISLSRTVGVVVAERLLDLFVVFGLLLVLFALCLYLPPSQVIFVAVASSLPTTVPLTPAGFGFVEIAMVYVLTTGFGLAQNDAVAVAVLDRAVSVFSVIVVGGILYLR